MIYITSMGQAPLDLAPLQQMSKSTKLGKALRIATQSPWRGNSRYCVPSLSSVRPTLSMISQLVKWPLHNSLLKRVMDPE